MKNCLKSLAIVAVFVAASFVGVKGSAAATGNVSVPMPGVGAVNINMAGGSNFAINTTPNICQNECASSLSQSLYDQDVVVIGWPADIYTVFCWRLAITPSSSHQIINNSTNWKCGVASVVTAPALVSSFGSTPVTGTLDTSSPNQCQWMLPCNGGYGYGSATGPSMVPNLDPYVGQSLAFDVLTNWCSYLAAPGYDIQSNLANGNVWNQVGVENLGCQSDDPSFTLDAARKLASASAVQNEVAFKVNVQAGPTDCHVPKVKGLTLRKAKARLHRANCGSTVRYVRGARAGRVRYQPLAVGTGKPRGYKVKLAVAR